VIVIIEHEQLKEIVQSELQREGIQNAEIVAQKILERCKGWQKEE
jgi:hypothetical protein